MDLQTRKMDFIREFLRIENEKIVIQLEKLLRLERKKQIDESLVPMSLDEFDSMINRAEKDSEENKLTNAKILRKNIDSWS